MACVFVSAHCLENYIKIELNTILAFVILYCIEVGGSDHSPSWQFDARPASFRIQNGGCVIRIYSRQKTIIKWPRRVRLHFMALIKISTYLIECLDISALIKAITIFPSLFWIQIFYFSVSCWLTKTLHVLQIPLRMCDGSNSQLAIFTQRTPWMQWRLHDTPWHFLLKMSSSAITVKFVLATCVVFMLVLASPI